MRPDTAFLRRVSQVVESRDGSAVVLVSEGEAGAAVAAALEGAGARPHRLGPAPDGDLDVRLAVLGGIDLAVVDCPSSPERTAIVERLVHHLRSQGVLLVKDRGDDDGSLTALLKRWADSGVVADADAVPAGKARPRRRAGAVQVERLPTHHEVTLRARQFLKMREEQANGYLELAGAGAGRVLGTVDAVRWTSRARVREAGEAPKPLPRRYAVPELSLREYHDVRCLPGQVAVQGSVILPDSFRHNQRKKLGNQRLKTVSEPFAVPDQWRAKAEPLPGDYFYLDSSYRGHFGHAMTEQLSRLWAWSQAKELFPELKVLMLEERRKGLYSFETQLYSAAGVPPEDIVVAPGPVQVERLIGATPMFSQPQYVHPDLANVWSTVSDALSGRATELEPPRRFFCSRRHGKRACQNTDEVERLFVDHGFSIVFPEDYSLADQALLFRDAEVVAGFAGSAMFNLLFATEAKKVIMVASENYWAQNEYMIAAVVGHDLTIAWSRPERARVSDAGFDRRTFHSPFTFDPDREGRLVLEVLQGL